MFYFPLDFWALEVHIFSFPCKTESRFVCLFVLLCFVFFFPVKTISRNCNHMRLGIRTFFLKKRDFKNQSLVVGSQELVMLWFINIFMLIRDVLVGCEMSPCIPTRFRVFTCAVSSPETWSQALCGLGWGHRKSQIGSWSPNLEKPHEVILIKHQVFHVPFWSRMLTSGLLVPLRAPWLNPKVLLIHLFICRMGFLLPFWMPENRGRRNCVE